MLFLDDVEVNVAAAREAGLLAAVYDGTSGVSALHRLLIDFGLDVTGCDAHATPPRSAFNSGLERPGVARRSSPLLSDDAYTGF